MKQFFFTLAMVSLISGITVAQIPDDNAKKKGLDAIKENMLRAQLGFLASDWMEGRETGEKGEYMAADYIASMLQYIGVAPAGDAARGSGMPGSGRPSTRERSYFQNFQLLRTSQGEEQKMSVISTSGSAGTTTCFTYNIDYSFRNSATGIKLEAPVVFVGYGIKTDKINDFAKKDVKGKVILRISGIPGWLRQSGAAELSAINASKDEAVRSLGVVAVIEVNPATIVITAGAERRDFMNMSPSEGRISSGKAPSSLSIPQPALARQVPRITVTTRVANEILEGAGLTVAEFVSQSNQKQIPVPEISGKKVKLESSVNTSLINVRNVLGMIEGVNKDEVIVVGAHYDHMGIGNGYLWNGADDNGSGTVGVLTLARAIMETGVKPQKTILFALWTAEEQGLIGSKYWVDNPSVPLGNVRMNINFDMISRYITDDQPNAVTMTYTSTHPLFREITEKNIARFGIELTPDFQPSDNPPGGSDHRSFVAKGIPIMRFKPGHREEYHTPADEISTIDWDIMEKIIRITFANLWDLANSDWK